MKTLIKLLLGLVVVLVIAVVAITVLIDPNDYKQEIQKVVKDNTGRDLIIDGEMKLSLFPWVGLELNKVGLSAAKGFGHAKMFDMNKMDVRLNVVPLLSQKIDVAKIVLDGVTVNLKINKKGVSSWDDIANKANNKPSNKPSTKPAKKVTKPSPEETKKSATEIPKFVLGGIEFTNANVNYVDLKSGTENHLKNFNLIIGQFELGKPFKMNMDFSVTNGEPAVSAKVAFGGVYTVNLKKQHYVIKGMFLNIDATGSTLPAGKQSIALNADADINLKKDKVILQKMTFKVANMVLNGQATINNATKAPKIKALLSIDTFNLRETLAGLKIALPEMADKTTLTAISAKLAIDTDLVNAKIQDLNLQLDQTHLTGTVDINNFAKPAVRYNLVLSEIDVDRYLPPVKEQPKSATTENTKTSAKLAKDIPIILPVEMMRGLDIKGLFTAKGFKVMNLKAQKTEIGVLAKNGVITINPLKMAMYKGNLDGKVIVDVRAKKPIIRLATKLKGVEAEPLMTDLMKMDKIQGNANATINISTQGESVNQFKAALNGKLNVAFKDGAIKGLNLEKELNKADAKLQGKKFDDSKTFAKTDFSDVTLSAIIKNGILTNNDFSLKAPLIRAGGAGKVNLVNSTLDYTVRVLITDKKAGQSGGTVDDLADTPIPINLSGPFSDIKIKVLLADVLSEKAAAALKLLEAKERAKLQAAVNKVKAKLKAQEDAEKAKLRAKEAKLKAELKAKEDKVKADLRAKEAAIQAKLKAEQDKIRAEKARIKAELNAKVAAEKKKAEDELKKKLLKLF